MFSFQKPCMKLNLLQSLKRKLALISMYLNQASSMLMDENSTTSLLFLGKSII